MTKTKKGQELNVGKAIIGTETFLEKNGKLLIGALIAIAVIAGGYFGYKYLYIAPREEKAQAAIFVGQTLFEEGNFDQALNGDNKGFTGFLKAADQYSGTKTANLLNAYIGLSYKALGKTAQAIEALNDFDSDDEMISPAILGALGNCYVDAGDLEKGVSFLEKAAKKADNSTLSPIFLRQAGLVLEKLGQNDKALALYEEIKNKYYNVGMSLEIDKYIERATAATQK
ncbi:MAG: tetratricopeptide repeat protein [Bacteroidaceae bacterium]|nr:tetratricopeptide repeat protein [Bacteroidaceae bacterium]MBP9638023.1 tetratricopeptide repeat protein [Bacteroidaceae bacterium]